MPTSLGSLPTSQWGVGTKGPAPFLLHHTLVLPDTGGTVVAQSSCVTWAAPPARGTRAVVSEPHQWKLFPNQIVQGPQLLRYKKAETRHTDLSGEALAAAGTWGPRQTVYTELFPKPLCGPADF